MRIEQVKFIPDILIAGKDFTQIKARRSGDNIGREERALSAHMSLVLTMWRLDMGIPLSTILRNNTHAIWSGMRRWMNIYDDIIDRDRNRYPSITELKHHSLVDGSRASDTTSELVKLTCSVGDIKRRRGIFRALAEFRAREYLLNLELSHELNDNSDVFSQKIEDLKLESSGLAMLYLARVVNTINGVNAEKAELCERGFYNLGMSGQYVDDLADFERDRGDPANLVVNVSKLFPDEHKLLQQKGFTRKTLRRCQNALDYVERRCEELTDGIPDFMCHTRRSVEFFADLIPLYAAFETEPYV